MPQDIFLAFGEFGFDAVIQEHCYDKSRAYREVFLPEIHAQRMSPAVRDKLIIFALDDDIQNPGQGLSQLLKTFRCIPASPNGRTFRYPRELIHPNGKSASLFDDNDGRFPFGQEYTQRQRLDVLSLLGMRANNLEWNEVIERARSVKDLNLRASGYEEALKRTKAVLSFMAFKLEEDGEPNDDEIMNVRSVEFLPYLRKPRNVPFTWKGEELPPTALLKAKDLFPSKAKRLVSASEPIFDDSVLSRDELTAKVKSLLNIEKDITLEQVKRQLFATISVDLQCYGDSSVKEVKKVCKAIYSYLQEQCEAEVRDFLSSELKFIFQRNHFLTIDQVALKCKDDLAPYLYPLKKDYTKRFRQLFDVLHIKGSFNAQDYQSLLLSVKNDYQNEPLSPEILMVTLRAAHTLAQLLKQSDRKALFNGQIYLPDSKRILMPAKELSMKDESCLWMPDEDGINYANTGISLEDCVLLGVNTRRQETLRKHSYGIPFGQKEKLTSRLKRILEGYPCDNTILKELLQNADDAQASKISFIVDPRSHVDTKVFGDCWKPLQGPALCVHNNSPFTENDIKGIQNLGEGSKGDDPNTTGQYGVGFNAVYHLTDAQSFISKGPEIDEMMCVFDPHTKYVPGASREEPGMAYKGLAKLRDIFSDVFPCYLEEHFAIDNATMFRFPLRNAGMAGGSDICDEPMTVERLKDLMASFKTELGNSLLFVNNVREIQLCSIERKSGKLVEDYKVEATLTAEDQSKREEFGAYVRQLAVKLRQGGLRLDEMTKKEVSYVIKLEDSNGAIQKWLVIQRVGFDEGVTGLPGCVTEAVHSGKLGLLPRGGVATLIDSSAPKVLGKAFCFLPLPISTGLPVHVNGHFALDHEARRNLWHDEDNLGYRGSWNNMLLQLVIAPCYVRLIEQVREYMPCHALVNPSMVIEQVEAKAVIKEYLQLFPSLKDTDPYWNELVKEAFRCIDRERARLFPVVRPTTEKVVRNGSEIKLANIEWFPPTGEGSNKAFFNNLGDSKSESVATVNSETGLLAQKENECLKETILSVGFNLLHVPMEIFEDLDTAGLKVRCISPDEVTAFLRTYAEELCRLGKLPSPLKDTPFKDVHKLELVLKYCRNSQAFVQRLHGLPLLLTQDEMLKTFDESHPVFLTKHLDIAPQSKSKFVHHHLLEHIFKQTSPTSCRVFKRFDIEEFARLLPSNLGLDFKVVDHYVTWDPESKSAGNPPSETWLRSVWRFLSEETSYALKIQAQNLLRVRYEDRWAFEKGEADFLSCLQDWCLVPAYHDDTKESARALVPIRLSESVVSFETAPFGLSNVQKALQNLSLPFLDVNVINESSRFDNAGLARKLVATLYKPAAILKALDHKCDVSTLDGRLSSAECLDILSYFNKDLNTNLERTKLKRLPFYETVQGEHISVQGKTVYVLPPGIPKDDMNLWEQTKGIVFLMEQCSLHDLYSMLGCSSLNTADLYCNIIFPRFQEMREAARLAHLKFLRERISESERESVKLIAAMKNLCFIPSENGTPKTASSYYDPDVPVFAVMLADEKGMFPPAPFSESNWLKFLRTVGLICSISEEDFLQFAKRVESEARTRESDATKKKSDVLVKHLFRHNLANDSLLRRVKTIEFVQPHEVSPDLKQLSPQYGQRPDGGLCYVCFEGSLVHSKDKIAWTSANILPMSADPEHQCIHLDDQNKKRVRAELGVLSEPQEETVVVHCSTICKNLSEDIVNTKAHALVTLKDVINAVYSFLCKKVSHNPDAVAKLKNCPCVLVEDGKRLVRPCQTVFELQEEQEIRPHLYKIPPEFAQYWSFLEHLGATKCASSIQYARVLEAIKQDSNGNELDPDQTEKAFAATKGLFQQLAKENEDSLAETSVLYLPGVRRGSEGSSSKVFLVQSTQLVCDNAPHFRHRISCLEPLLLVGFKECKLETRNDEELAAKLPARLRVKLLSDVVSEKLVDESVISTMAFSGDTAGKLKRLLNSLAFRAGFSRIVRHEDYQQKRNTGEDLLRGLNEKLSHLRVYASTSLRTHLVHDGMKIPSSEDDVNCFEQRIEENGTETWTIYIQKGVDLVECVSPVAEAINRITGSLLGNSVVHLPSMLQQIPEKIKSFLDRNKIREDNTLSSAATSIPQPGSFINIEDHHLLINSFEDFEPGELAGYEVDDPSFRDEDDPPTYIFVVVVEEVAPKGQPGSFLTKRYRVDVGENDPADVDGIKLYKIRHDKASPTWELATYEGPNDESRQDKDTPVGLEEAKNDITKILEETWGLPEDKKRTILKRLFLKWHPDKNPGNEEFCKEVFQFIQSEIERRERKRSLDSTGSSSSSPFTPYRSYFRRWAGRARTHSSAYSSWKNVSREDWAVSSISRPNPQPAQAKRWFRQAEADLLAVTNDDKTECPAYEWASFKCHQAAEKALKAAQYTKDANKKSLHNLEANASSLCDTTLSSLASELERLVGRSPRMRYPDCLSFPRIPHDEYTEETATRAHQLAQQILDRVKTEFI